MLKLLIEREITSPNIILRWCIDQATQMELEKRRIKKPYLLLAVCDDKRHDRIFHYLVPFGQMEEYIQLSYPGESKIFATIVWSDIVGYKGLWKDYLRREDGWYATTLISHHDGQASFYRPASSIELAELVLTVPQELFAKEPPAWEKRWVNLWYENKPKNQCYYRRRRFVAYSIQPPAMLLWTVLVKILMRWTAAAVLIILGYWFDIDDQWNPKKWKPLINLKPLIHPWRMDMKDLISWHFREQLSDNTFTAVVLGCIYIYVVVTAIFLSVAGLYEGLKLMGKGVKILDERIMPALRRLQPKLDSGRKAVIDIMSPVADKITRSPWSRKAALVIMTITVIGLIVYAKSLSSKPVQPGFFQSAMAAIVLVAFFIYIALALFIAKQQSKRGDEGVRTGTTKVTPEMRKIAERYAPYQALLCENLGKVDPKKVVPFQQKVHLYYQDLKSMVCKPFAG